MKHLFLRGPHGVGKSSLIREAVLSYLPQIGGFYVQRLFLGDRYWAFGLNPVSRSEEYFLNKRMEPNEEAEGVFLYCGGDGRWHFKSEVFEIFGVQYLTNSGLVGKKMILLDEVGGVDLQCPTFLQALLDTLYGDIPCLGVLKADINRRKLDSHLADKSTNTAIRKMFFEKLIDHPDVKILDFRPEVREWVKEQVHSFVEEAMAE